MNSNSDTNNGKNIEIQPAQHHDRAALALLAPEHRSLVESCWARVALEGNQHDRPIVGAVMLTNRYVNSPKAALGIRLNMLPQWYETDLPNQLLEQAVTAAREWGAKQLHMLEHIPNDGERAALFRRLGFSEADTFDAFELDLKEAIEGWQYVHKLLEKTFKNSPQFDIREIEERYARPIALAWAKWIGGQAEDHVDSIIRGIAGLPSVVDPKFSRIALLDGKLVAMALCRIKDMKLYVEALAVAPDSRLSGVQTQMLVELAIPALEAGAKVQYFEAGRSQPDTQRVAKRLDATLVASKIEFHKDLMSPA